jgi:hypothetical protein
MLRFAVLALDLGAAAFRAGAFLRAFRAVTRATRRRARAFGCLALVEALLPAPVRRVRTARFRADRAAVFVGLGAALRLRAVAFRLAITDVPFLDSLPINYLHSNAYRESAIPHQRNSGAPVSRPITGNRSIEEDV